ncbi:MAG: Crp/Fnr family transcriptional regulator [bacterium]|jgi:CRP-like cAMP-binding protein|nr:Crp/Fnr family transcriptional regulator [candidate division KSB1 bacterium]MDH7560200.1 Crp/Fnr family transcriptional regulator [bacterium]
MDLRLLRSIPIFSGLDAQDLERIAQLCVHKTCAANQLILVEEESGQSLFIIKRGSVKVSHVSDEGREVILSILNAGDFFGEMALLDGRGRSANVTALVETELLVLRRGDFLGLLEDYPQISIALLRELAGRIRRSDSHISTLSLKDAMGRVAMALVHVAEKTGRPRGREMVIPKLPIQQDLANMAGTARETISRAMGQFEEMGYLEREGHRVVVKDFEAFKRAFG